jgi:3-hexulose-6-phosphate synthase
MLKMAYLQTAIDRVSVEQARDIIEAIKEASDIIEIGTSLIKDYGLKASVGTLKQAFPGLRFLADIKTIDEGAWEFERTFEAGADIATVMGASSLSTIRACRDIAQKFNREYCIDLLETGDDKIRALTGAFDDAIYALHLPSDLAGDGLREMVEKRIGFLQDAKRIACAGGVNLETIPFLKAAGVEIIIVGGAITKSGDMNAAARRFKQAIMA